MSDPRTTPANARVAHDALKGQIDHPNFVATTPMQVATSSVRLSEERGGMRERELLLGQTFQVLEYHQGFAFGFAGRDGYCGYVADAALVPYRAPSHRVDAVRSYVFSSPDLKSGVMQLLLSFGSLVQATNTQGDWSEIGPNQWAPSVHLRPAGSHADDPVEVARRFLGTPYLWGGNSSLGIDCSGLIQAAAHAAGIACPGDSDQQARAFASGRAADAPAKRGDLFFWKGHVALAIDGQHLIHANAHHMAVVQEGIAEAIARINAQGGGPVTARGAL